MIIAITGTPGCGKTTVTKVIGKKMKANVIAVRDLIKKKKIKSEFDKKRMVAVVRIVDIKSAVKKAIKKNKINIVESHLAHFIKADMIFVLRCRPDVLEKRLEKKKWTESKIIENVRAEILDTTTIEALEMHKKQKIVELDTTGKDPAKVAQTIVDIINKPSLQKKYLPGQLDWSEKFSKYLTAEEYKP